MLDKNATQSTNMSQLTLFGSPVPAPVTPIPPTATRRRGRPKKKAPTIIYNFPTHIVERRITLDKLERDVQMLVSYEDNKTASSLVSYTQAKENFNRSWNKALEQGYSPADLFAIMRKVK